jgi:iron complex outermembrane receptor protein
LGARAQVLAAQLQSWGKILKKSAFSLTTAVCLVFTTQAHAQTAPAERSKDEAAIVVVGSGETRSVSTLVPSNLDVLPPGTSVQKALNFLPGVMSQSIDALGLNEQSMSLQVRGFPPPIWAMRSTAFRWATAPTTITTA